MNNLRKIVMVDTGEQVRMSDLKKGDRFDVFEATDNVSDGEYIGRWVADTDGFIQNLLHDGPRENGGMGAIIAHKETT